MIMAKIRASTMITSAGFIIWYSDQAVTIRANSALSIMVRIRIFMVKYVHDTC
jgi:hypothetical protein